VEIRGQPPLFIFFPCPPPPHPFLRIVEDADPSGGHIFGVMIMSCPLLCPLPTVPTHSWPLNHFFPLVLCSRSGACCPLLSAPRGNPPSSTPFSARNREFNRFSVYAGPFFPPPINVFIFLLFLFFWCCRPASACPSASLNVPVFLFAIGAKLVLSFSVKENYPGWPPRFEAISLL